MSDAMKPLIGAAADRPLTREEAESAFRQLFEGEATPSQIGGLLMALRTVQNLWRIENQNRHAQEIASRAGALYEKFAGFAEDLEKVGLNIDRARNAYDDARKKLSTGRGNLVRQAEMLKEMGAETSKSLPDKLTALSHHEDDEEDAHEAGALPGGEDS